MSNKKQINEKRDEIQELAVERLEYFGFRGVVKMAPRVGKTRTIVLALEKLVIQNKANRNLLPIVWVVPYRENIATMRNEIALWARVLPRIEIINRTDLISYAERGFRYETIVVSEIHKLSERQRSSLLALSPTFLIGESGTISAGKTKILAKEMDLHVVFDYTAEEAISSEIISNYQIYVVKCDLEESIKTVNTGKGFMVSERQQYRFLNKIFLKWKNAAQSDPRVERILMASIFKRSKFLYEVGSKVNLAKRIIQQLDRCLIFTPHTVIADKLGECVLHSQIEDIKNRAGTKGLLRTYSLVSSGKEGRLYSNKKESELASRSTILNSFNDGEINKLAVCKLASMSITFKNLKDIVIHQTDSNEEDLVQRAFRACNKDEDKVARVFICMANKTRDEVWVKSALKGLNKDKIIYTNFEELIENRVFERGAVTAPELKK